MSSLHHHSVYTSVGHIPVCLCPDLSFSRTAACLAHQQLTEYLSHSPETFILKAWEASNSLCLLSTWIPNASKLPGSHSRASVLTSPTSSSNHLLPAPACTTVIQLTPCTFVLWNFHPQGFLSWNAFLLSLPICQPADGPTWPSRPHSNNIPPLSKGLLSSPCSSGIIDCSLLWILLAPVTPSYSGCVFATVAAQVYISYIAIHFIHFNMLHILYIIIYLYTYIFCEYRDVCLYLYTLYVTNNLIIALVFRQIE